MIITSKTTTTITLIKTIQATDDLIVKQHVKECLHMKHKFTNLAQIHLMYKQCLIIRNLVLVKATKIMLI